MILETILEAETKEDFNRTYGKLIGLVENLVDVEIKVLIHFLKFKKLNFPKKDRTVFAKQERISVGSVNNAISKLVKKNLLVRLEPSTYRITEDYLIEYSKIPNQYIIKLIFQE